MVITKLALPRRTFLRGMGATVALPLLDAMVPAMKAAGAGGAPFRRRSTSATARTCSSGRLATEGVGFELSPTLKPLEAVPRPDDGLHRAR